MQVLQIRPAQVFDSVQKLIEGNSMENLVIAAGVLGGGLILLLILRGVFSARLAAIARRTKNRMDDLAAVLIRKSHVIFLTLLAAYAASLTLVYPEGTEGIRIGLGRLTLLFFFLQVGLWGNGAITFWLSPPEEATKRQEAMARTLQSVGYLCRLAIWSVVLLLALDNLGVDITALVAGLGVGTLAVGLALNNILGDLLASISIVLDRPFVIGDFIIVGDLMGTVERIGLQTTRLQSLSGEQLVFSNSDLLGSRIRNYKRMRERRIVFSFGVTYDTPQETLAAIPEMVRAIVGTQEQARFDRAHFKSYGDSSLDFEVVYYVEIPDYATYMDIQHAVNLALYRKFEDERIEFAYPTRTLYLNQVAGAASRGV